MTKHKRVPEPSKAVVDAHRLSPALVRHLLNGRVPEGVTEARFALDLFADREGGAEITVTYDDPQRPATIVTLRAPGVPLFGAMFLRDHPDELADIAREMIAYGVERWLARLSEAGRRYDLALGVLAMEAEGDELARDDRSAVALERTLEKHARNLLECVAAVPREARILDGSAPLWLDEALAGYLDKIGTEAAKEAARDWRKKAGEAAAAYRAGGDAIEWLKPWLSDLPDGDAGLTIVGALPAVHDLALFIWLEEVQPELRNRAGLVVPVMYDVTDFHSRGRVFSGDQLTFAGREIAKVASEAHAAVDLDVLRRGLDLLGSKLSHDVLRFEVFEAHERYQLGERYPNILEIEGGWSGLAERLGYSPKKHMPDVRNVVYAQAHFRFRFPDGSHGNMLSYTERAAVGRERARVTLTLGAPLCPGYLPRLRETMGQAGLIARQAQRLVPMPRHLPPFYGRPNEHGQQASFSLALMTEFRERAAELAKDGSVYLSLDRLTALADRVSLPRRLIVPVLEHWTHDAGNTPAFLERVGPDRYTLGPDHAAELAFIIEAGRRELRGIARGKASARQRTADAPKRARRKRAG